MLQLIWAAREDQEARRWLEQRGSLETALAREDQLTLGMQGGGIPERGELRELEKLLGMQRSWGRRLILAMTAMQALVRLGRAGRAVTVGARGVEAYRGFRRFLKRHRVEGTPPLLSDFEGACERALRACEPPRRPGHDPVSAVAKAAAGMRRYRSTDTARAMSALDALITIGGSTAEVRFDLRVAREIGGMLGARLLFLHRPKRWVRLRAQSEHTLSTWSIRRLSRSKRLRAVRIRPRPEFWRSEQRRPGGVLAFPLGEGVACLARRRPFDRREVAAARTVLRFLEARLARERGLPAGALPAMPRRVPRLPSEEGLVGQSPAWREVLRQVALVADSSCSVLLTGDTGTGKEKIARALHAASLRSRFDFVPVNCGAIPSTLLASELFGHIRGAFTGADRNREGLFVRANRGTLFLDESADMPPEMQVALLRVIEDREIRPVGSARTISVDVRLVSASARDLALEVSAGRFREDLYHRLDVVRITLPPLRERREDIALLTQHLLARTPENAGLHPDALALLLAHDWPGNVRELDNVLRAAAVLSEGAEITPALLRGVMDQRRLFRRVAPPEPEMAPRQITLLRELGRGWRSATELALVAGVSGRTVNRDLDELGSRGLLDTVGEGRARRYARKGGAGGLSGV